MTNQIPHMLFLAVSVAHVLDVCSQAPLWGSLFRRVFLRTHQSYENGIKSKEKKGTPRGAILTILTRLHIPYRKTKKRGRDGHFYKIDSKDFGKFAHMVHLYDQQFLNILSGSGVPNTIPYAVPPPPFNSGESDE
jgi:hypothetical protein